MAHSLKRDRRALITGAVAASAAMSFGYDTGIGGGVIALQSFQQSFYGRNLTPAKRADLSSNVVSVLFGGAFFGSLFAGYIAAKLGRRATLAIAGLVYLFGAFLQIGQTNKISYIYAGRAISGLGIGAISNISPLYIGETAPRARRGAFICCFQMALVTGGCLAYFITYAASLHLSGTVQWRFPLAFQCVPAGFLLLGLLVADESPRWLASVGRSDEALHILARLRGMHITDQEVVEEMAEIEAQLAEQRDKGGSFKLRDILERGMLRRFAAAYMMSLGQIFCGHPSILYYGPSIFASVGFTNTSSALLATGLFTVIKVALTPLVIIFGIERFGRKRLLVYGAAGQSTVLFVLGALLYARPTGSSDHVDAANRAMIAMLYLFIIIYSFSWGPLPFAYLGEIFPFAAKPFAMSTSIALVWLANFGVSKATPSALLHIKAGWWIFLACCNLTMFFCCLLIPETKGISVEGMDVLFGSVHKEERERHVKEKVLFVSGEMGAPVKY